MIDQAIPGIDAESAVKTILSGGQVSPTSMSLKPSWKLFKLLKTVLICCYDLLRLPKNYRHFVNTCLPWIEKNRNIQNLSPQQLDKLMEEFYHFASEGFRLHIQGTFAYSAFYNALMNLIPKELEISPSLLIVALGTIEEAKMKKALWHLAHLAKNSPQLRDIIENTPPEKISETIAQLDNIPQFQKSLQQFWDDFGHMGDNLIEVMAPRWRDQPTSVWKMVKVQMQSTEESPEQKEQQLHQQRQQAITKIKRHLSHGWRILLPFRRLQFSLTLKLITFYAPYRENSKFQMLKGFSVLQRITLNWGQILTEQGHLESPQDIFFLKESEIREILAGKWQTSTTLQTAAERKQLMEKWLNTSPPRNIYVKGNRIRREYDPRPRRTRTTKRDSCQWW